MWTPSLAALTVLFAVPVVHGLGNPNCFQENASVQTLENDRKALQAALEDSQARLCNQNPTSELIVKSIVSYASRNFAFTFERGEGPQDDKECIQAFGSIMESCIVDQKVSGGTINADGNGPTYTVSTQLVGDLEARAKKPKAPAKAPAKPPTKPPAKTSTKPIATSTQKTSSQVQSSAAKTSSIAKPTPTKTCKKFYSELLASSKQAALAEKRDETLNNRQGFSGSRVHVEKRSTPKSGKACNFDLKALNYPEKKEMPKNANWYGFIKPDVCDDLVFRAAAKPAAGIPDIDYQVEHVLEWNVVTRFFDWVRDQKPGNVFVHPDKAQNGKKVDFCEYWRQTWTTADVQLQTFKITDGSPDSDGPAKGVLAHLASAFPGKDNFPEEFVYLHTLLNAPAKSDMWKPKKPGSGIYDQTRLTRNIKGRGSKNKKTLNIDTAKSALLELKHLMGARKYMNSKEIQGILAKQKVRMGKMIERLDAEMVNYPRVNFNAWQSQQLGSLWNKYMDQKFAEAKARTDRDMDNFLAMLVQSWSPVKNKDQNHKDFFASIEKVKKEWALEKRRLWVAPW